VSSRENFAVNDAATLYKIIDECVPRLALFSRDSWRPRRQH
jgi:hypothetical protein